MKRLVALVISLMMLTSCGGKLATSSDSEQKLIDLLTLWWMTHRSNVVIMTTLDLDKVGNVVTTKNGTVIPKSSSVMASAVSSNIVEPKFASTDPTSDVIYITGLKGTTSMMLELTLDLSTPGTSKSVRTVLFQEQVMNSETGVMETQLLNRPFSAYPSAFTISGVKYLLFSRIGYGDITKFKLMKYVSEDSSSITYVESNEWDFSVLEADIKAKNDAAITAINVDKIAFGKTELTSNSTIVWVAAPDFNPITNTMYFGYKLAFHQNGDDSEDTAPHCLLYQSQLVGTQFQIPTQITGVANPLDKQYYVGALVDKEVKDFVVLNDLGYYSYVSQDSSLESYKTWHGMPRFGRIYTTRDNAVPGQVTAYFTDLFASFPRENIYEYTGGVWNKKFSIVAGSKILATDTELRKNVWNSTTRMNDIYETTIDSSGVSTNLNKIVFDDETNMYGLNYISNLSEDGKLMYVSHMDICDEIFGPTMGIVLTHLDSYAIPAWNGQVKVYQNVAGVWYRVANITKQDVTVE